jgi:hypothetical protein
MSKKELTGTERGGGTGQCFGIGHCDTSLQTSVRYAHKNAHITVLHILKLFRRLFSEYRICSDCTASRECGVDSQLL